MRFISVVFLGLSAFTLTQASGLGNGGECKVADDCKSGVCNVWVGRNKSTTGKRCNGSGNEGDYCLVSKAGSCNGALICHNELGGQTGTCERF
ncbi:hypothetical protein BKA65DRAFT_79802 [Rhexocercosporidium sp. MPI-PUGE-AT-0058]|nr:hypothetical protein BKA65DRAFT_79802 [Rhexocercosporidium sp. MPI-PUGE-AT-0058]